MRNPFIDLSRAELAEALTRGAERLAGRGGGTPEQRAAFAEELRFLLIAAAGRLAVSRFMPHTPAFEIDRAANPDTVAVYMDFVARECAAARFDALQQAAEGLMTPTQLTFFLDARPDSMTTDQGCRAALTELAAMKSSPRSRKGMR